MKSFEDLEKYEQNEFSENVKEYSELKSNFKKRIKMIELYVRHGYGIEKLVSNKQSHRDLSVESYREMLIQNYDACL